MGEPLPDDHVEKWTYKKHTKSKHDVLHYYLKVWTSIVSDERFSLRIFDCFAGRGDYYDSDGATPKSLDNISSEADYPGSPQIILDAVSEHNNKFKSAECYFLEPTEENRIDLEDNLEATDHPSNVNPHIINGRFPDDILDVVSSSNARSGFALFFIDPFNIKFLDYDSIVDISSTNRFECLITLMTGQLIRWQDSSSHKKGYKNLYGLPNWKERLESYVPNDISTREAEFYCERLEEKGPNHTLAYMTTEGDSRRLKYHQVFTSNSDKGLEVMKESMTRCGSDFTLAYAPKRSEISHEQQTFTGGDYLTEEERAKSWILSRFADKILTFDEVVTKAIAERRYADSLRQHYRIYLKELDSENEIEIPDRGLGQSSLKEHYEIHFPESE